MKSTEIEKRLKLYYKSLKVVDEALVVAKRSLRRERKGLIDGDYFYRWVQERSVDLGIEAYQALNDWRTQLLGMIEENLNKLITARNGF
jgi:hypothetical protein